MPAFVPLLLAGLMGLAAAQAAAGAFTLRASDGTDIPVATVGDGARLLVWLPSERGITAGDRAAAAKLAERGFAVWLADLHGARFLPAVPSSMGELPAEDVTAVLARATRDRDAVMVIAGERGAPLTLEGLLRYRADAPAAAGRIRGAIFLSPNFYLATPEPGREPEYATVTARNPVPVAVVQPTLSPWHWYADELTTRLSANGAPVYMIPLQGVRDRFYFRDDASPAEHDMAARLPAVIESAWNQIEGKP